MIPGLYQRAFQFILSFFHGKKGIESIADHSIGFDLIHWMMDPIYSSFDDPSVCLAVDGDSYFIFFMWAVRDTKLAI